MTIIEASDRLVKWYQKNDTFNFKDNYKSLMQSHITETEEADRAAILCALKSLEEHGAIKSAEIKSDKSDNEKYYILSRPFETIEQNVVLGYSTVSALCDIAKQASEMLDSDEIILDPMQITEQDILLIINILLEVAKRRNVTERDDDDDNVENN